MVVKHITGKIQSFILSLIFILNLFVPAFNAYAANSVPTEDISFKFNENSVSVSNANGESYTSNKTSLTISKAGVYRLSGTCKNGPIVVDARASGSTLILDNFNFVSNSDSTPFVFNGSTNLFLVGDNKITCTSENLAESAISLGEGVNLSIDGTNSLTITGFPTGISGLQDFVGDSQAPSFHMKNGFLNCYTSGSAISVENVKFSGGNLVSNNAEMGIYCKNLNISNGSSLALNCKVNCIDAENIDITGGTIGLRSDNENGLNASNNINISGDSHVYVDSGDKAIHADNELKIGDNNGSNPRIDISNVEEGLEAAKIYLYSGVGNITSKDDGINAANKKLGNYDFSIEINGGTWNINAEGDGLDSNGSITMNDGVVNVFGSESNDNAAVDYETNFTVNDGKILAIGMANMAMLPTKGDYVSFGKANLNNSESKPSDEKKIANDESEKTLIDGNVIFDKIYSEVNENFSKWITEKPKLFSFLYQKYNDLSDSDKQTINSYLSKGDAGVPKLKSFLVEKYNVAPYSDKKMLNDYVLGNVEPIDRYSSQDGSPISIKAGDIITIKDSKGNVVASTSAVKSANHVLFAKTDPNETYSLFISSLDFGQNNTTSTSNGLDVSADYWLENGKTCTYVRHQYNENFLLEDSDGTKAWYGIRDPNRVLEENSVFHVQWFNSAKISENERERYYQIYEQLDDDLKEKAKNGNLWFFDMGVRKPDGTEYEKLDNSVCVDIELGNDWSTNDLSVVCVTNSTDEKIQYEVLKNSVYVPSETGEKKYLDAVARLTINHFSPYALVDGLSSNRYSTGDKCSIVFMAMELIAVSAAAFMIFNRKSIYFHE